MPEIRSLKPVSWQEAWPNEAIDFAAGGEGRMAGPLAVVPGRSPWCPLGDGG